MKIDVQRNRDTVKIYFNDILHFAGDIKMVHSWQFEREKLYYIEYITKYGSTIADYDHKEYWQEILKQLDKII